MTGSVALDVVIGLVFIYLLYSLLASIIQEIIATWIGLRANVLQQGIIRMLNDGDDGPWYTARFRSFWKVMKRYHPDGFAGAFYHHPLVKYLGEDAFHNKPSYISAQNFSKIIIDLLKGDNLALGTNAKDAIQQGLDAAKTRLNNKGTSAKPQESADTAVWAICPDTFQFINSLWLDSQGDVAKFQSLLEKWYEDAGERITGWYKRYVQLFLFFIGMGIAVVANVDTFEITAKLSNDPVLRQQIVSQAESFAKTYPEYERSLQQQKEKADSADTVSIDQQIQESKAKRDTLNMLANKLLTEDISKVSGLFGLNREFPDKILVQEGSYGAFAFYEGPNNNLRPLSTCMERYLTWWLRTRCSSKNAQITFEGKKYWAKELCWTHKIVIGLQLPSMRNWFGYFFTAIAISLGAPFWFDLLNKLMKVRSSTKQSTQEGTADASGKSAPQVVRVG